MINKWRIINIMGKFNEIKIEMPNWLKEAINDDEKFHSEIKIKEILKDSLFYPCCNYDQTPIKEFKGKVFSYIYADLEKKNISHKKELLAGFREFDNINSITNFRLIKERKVSVKKIGLSGKYNSRMLKYTTPGPKLDSLNWSLSKAAEKFIHWSIWEIESGDLLERAPKYFSLLYLGGYEMNDAYQLLYSRLKTTPKILAIIMPGMGFWDEEHSFFKKVLLDNKGGIPPYLLSCDSYFSNFVDLFDTNNNLNHEIPRSLYLFRKYDK